MTSYIRIKMGAVEVEFEGDEQFLRNELLQVVSETIELYRNAGVAGAAETGVHSLGTKGRVTGSAAAIATRLGSSTGSDLILAVAAHLSFVEDKSTFGRQEILDEMKAAAAYYKRSYGANLTNYLQTLRNAGKLNELGKDTYALSSETRKELEERLSSRGGEGG